MLSLLRMAFVSKDFVQFFASLPRGAFFSDKIMVSYMKGGEIEGLLGVPSNRSCFIFSVRGKGGFIN